MSLKGSIDPRRKIAHHVEYGVHLAGSCFAFCGCLYFKSSTAASSQTKNLKTMFEKAELVLQQECLRRSCEMK